MSLLKTPHLVLKGLGFCDVFLIYESPSFEPYLTDVGPIENILNSHVFNCFSFLGRHADAMFESLQDTTFIGVGLLKLNPLAKAEIIQIEVSLVEYLKSTLNDNWFILGTLGWNELILFIKSDKLGQVAQNLLHFSYDQKTDSRAMSNYLLKTFSTIGINHKKLPSPRPDQTLAKIEQDLLIHSGLKEEIGPAIIPSVSIAATPLYYNSIRGYWEEEGFFPTDVIGRFDIIVGVPERTTWANFLAHILHFRYEFRDRILATSTNISLNYEVIPPKLSDSGNGNNAISEASQNIISKMLKYFNENENESEKLFGMINSKKLTKYFFSIKEALQNPMHGNVFWDMSEYYEFLLRSATRIKNSPSSTEETSEELFLNATYSISRGAAVRQYGIYGFQEGPPGDLSFVGGGVQRALLALEYIPSYVLNRIKARWYGFLIAEDPKFAHYNEVIVVPFSDLWRP